MRVLVIARLDRSHGYLSVRTIFSGRYKGQLADFAKTFTDEKSELQFLITQKSAATVTAMKGNLDGVSKKMDRLVEFLEKKSPDEQKAMDIVARNGGEAAVIGVSKYSRTAVTDIHSPLVPTLERKTFEHNCLEAGRENDSGYQKRYGVYLADEPRRSSRGKPVSDLSSRSS